MALLSCVNYFLKRGLNSSENDNDNDSDKEITVSRFSVVSTSSVHGKISPLTCKVQNTGILETSGGKRIKARVSTVVSAEVYAGPEI